MDRLGHGRGAAASRPPVSPRSSGPKDGDASDDDFLTPAEMRDWAQRELRDAAKALDLRAQELIKLVTAYAAGTISPEQADELHSRYTHRWGEALPGVTLGDVGSPPLRSDQELIAEMDERNPPFISPREARDARDEIRAPQKDPNRGKYR